ncbi:uncharacterized protein METZ01_LOCUS400023, partial [marine metagenome]
NKRQEIAMLKTGKRNAELMKTGFACPTICTRSSVG